MRFADLINEQRRRYNAEAGQLAEGALAQIMKKFDHVHLYTSTSPKPHTLKHSVSETLLKCILQKIGVYLAVSIVQFKCLLPTFVS